MDSATIGSPLEPQELQRMQRYWNATLYPSAGMIYLRDNPLLRVPLKPEHVKRRSGTWRAAAISNVYSHG
jgi:xylulose-5-phosphate/fructose-6-phosphate phosphoketolase